MRQLTTKPFPYFVGIHSLEELVTKDSKVCVINILGNESRKVTPVSHEYSGGNIVAGVQYGRESVLETKIGDIPVYKSIRDVIENGHHFDIGVIYLPPLAVSQAVSELVHYEEGLKRIVIVTEKIPVRDSGIMRFLCQDAGVDIIGANCLGVANIWDHVRVGGALGGDDPESLRKGSVAIHSNSGNFTTTIAEYLKTGGFGISTAVSSGKDVYVHFALPEFLLAAQNDSRTKAAALYVEPGGYYEKMALDWIKQRVIGFNKPLVCCVTGRWKKDIMRSCGHAGALSGSGDDAESKEKWFDEYFGVGVFNPLKPRVSKRGVRVASIQHIPEAMKYVFEKIDEKPDFEPEGDLSLKPWLADKFISLPAHLNIAVVKAMPPYDEQIEQIRKHVGANYLRQNMRNKSGASRINPETDVAELHGKTVLELSEHTMEELIYFSLAKVLPEKDDIPLLNFLLNIFLKVEENRMDVVDLAKANNATPNAYIASQIALIGIKDFIHKASLHTIFIIDIVREYGLNEKSVEFTNEINQYIIKNLFTKKKKSLSETDKILLKEIKKSTKSGSIALEVCKYIIALADKMNMQIKDVNEFLLSAAVVRLFWKPMMEKRVSRLVVEDVISYFYIISRIVAYAVIDRKNNKYWKKFVDKKQTNINSSFTQNAFEILYNRVPTEEELFEFKTLIGLTLTNGPGTLSAKGAKESVSARNSISMAFVGFLSNTGLAHGGNGFEAVEYLLNNFRGAKLKSPGDKNHNLDLKAMANKAAKIYGGYKKKEKELGGSSYAKIPCVNHPVFKGNDVNIDPRENFVRNKFEKKGIHNVFLEFYHYLVQELYDEGITKNVFCVNIDAVLAVISLKLVWTDLNNNIIDKKQVQDLVFTMFLLGRAIGISSEIADHRDRGQDMDCRTPSSQLGFVI